MDRKTISPVVAFLFVVILMHGAGIYADTGERIYNETCARCHTPDEEGNTVDGAPAIGNDLIWKYRMDIGGGREGMYRSAIKGMNYMPPKGGFDELSDDEVRAAVDYMIDSSL